MSGTIDVRLAELGITLPKAAAPAANYVPYTISGSLVFVAGQVPFTASGTLEHKGRLGDDYSIEQGYESAKLCGLNIIAQVKAALGDLDRVTRIIKLGGFVQCVPEFGDHPKVINGASDLMVEVFGKDVGGHARFAVGAPALPMGVATEVDAIVEFK